MSRPFSATSPRGVGLAALVVVAVGACGGGASAPRFAGANVILISYDTLRADHLGTYGYHRNTSPNLDALARDGAVFDMAIAQASSTYPSHMALFQSRLASAVSDRTPVLAEVLRQAGYRTAGFTGGGNVSARFGFDRGFDLYEESRDASGGLEETFPRLEAWLRQEDRQPFFVFLHTYDIHSPYAAPEPYGPAFFTDDYQGEVTAEVARTVLEKTRRVGAFKDFDGEVHLTAADRRRIVALYDGGILYADSYLARLRALLDELALTGRTVLIFLSDHGEELWDHDQVLHSFTVYQEVIRVPLVLRLPDGNSAGARVAQPVQLIDVAPTALELVGLRPPPTMQGRSLLPLLAGRELPPAAAISEMLSLKALLHGRTKLIADRTTGDLRLFDLVADPGEARDLAGDRAHDAEAAYRELRRTLGPGAARDIGGGPRHFPDDPELVQQLRALGYLE